MENKEEKSGLVKAAHKMLMKTILDEKDKQHTVDIYNWSAKRSKHNKGNNWNTFKSHPNKTFIFFLVKLESL